MLRWVTIAVVSTLGWLPAGAGHSAVAAAPRDDLRLVASVDGRLVEDGRLTINPSRTTELTVTVSNGTADPARATAVRLSGAALGLTLFAYDAALLIDVPPGATVTRTFPLPTAGLQRQVTGLVPVSVRLLGPDGAVVAESSATGDVRGSIWSVYGVFWIAVMIVSALAWAGALMALGKRRLPPGPWRRATRFLPAGAGLGLSAVLTLAVLRIAPPTPAVATVLVTGSALGAFVLGHLAPYSPEAAPQLPDAVPDVPPVAPYLLDFDAAPDRSDGVPDTPYPPDAVPDDLPDGAADMPYGEHAAAEPDTLDIDDHGSLLDDDPDAPGHPLASGNPSRRSSPRHTPA